MKNIEINDPQLIKLTSYINALPHANIIIEICKDTKFEETSYFSVKKNSSVVVSSTQSVIAYSKFKSALSKEIVDFSRKYNRFYIRIINNVDNIFSIIRYADGNFYDFAVYKNQKYKEHKFVCTKLFPTVKLSSNTESKTVGKTWVMVSMEAKVIYGCIGIFYLLIFLFFYIYPFSFILPLFFVDAVAMTVSLISIFYHFYKKNYFLLD